MSWQDVATVVIVVVAVVGIVWINRHYLWR